MSTPTIRAMTYNINAARAHPDRLDELLSVVDAQRPDIVGLQEVDRGAARSSRVNQADWLAQRLGLEGIFGSALDFDDGGQYGNALLTRHRVLGHQVLQLPVPTPADYTPPSDTPQWLIPYLYEPRSVLGARLDLAGTPIRAFVAHFGLTPEQRTAQVHETLRFIDDWHGDEPALLLCDANATPQSDEIGVLAQQLVDVCRDLPLDRRGTRPMDSGARCIDYVFTTEGFGVESAAVVFDAAGASDHLPLVASLKLYD